MIEEIKISEKEKWDTLVKSFDNYDVFYLNNYAKAFQDQGDGVPVLIYAEYGETKAINVIMKRDIAECTWFEGKIETQKYFDLSSPYGYGGFLFDGDEIEFEHILIEYEKYCIKQGYVSEFVRFELLESYNKYYRGEVESRSHNVICDLSLPIEEIIAGFEYKVRKNYRRAKKRGLEIIIDERGETLEDFFHIYYGTMKRTGAKEDFFFKEKFFRTLNEMRGNFAYFYVLYDGRVISTELVLSGSENVYSYLGGTDSNYFDVRPNDFLKVEIIKWAKECGFKNFILGGGYGSDDGIFKYKKSFAPKGIVDFYIGKKIFDEEVYDMLVQLKGTSDREESAFFPQYRG